jgi:hypothetical protein
MSQRQRWCNSPPGDVGLRVAVEQEHWWAITPNDTGEANSACFHVE